MSCKECGGSGYRPNIYEDEPCPKCSPCSDEFQVKIIAAYLREWLNLKDDESKAMSDKEIIRCHGGDWNNRIIATGWEDGLHLYRCRSDGITTYQIIDEKNLSAPIILETFVVPDTILPADRKSWADWLDSDHHQLPCVADESK